MKFDLFLLACGTLLLSACGPEQQQSQEAPPSSTASPPAAESARAVEPEPAPASPPAVSQPKQTPALTPELENAAVMVRVSIGSTIERNYPGVILHPDAAGVVIPEGFMGRYIAVVIPDFDEEKLRDPYCVISVVRNRKEQDGVRITLLKGSLVHQNATSRFAVVECAETFPYKLDVGLRLAGSGTGAEAAGALRVSTDPSTRIILAQMLGATNAPEGLKIGTDADGLTSADAMMPLLDDAARLAGFATRRPGGNWKVTPSVIPVLKPKMPAFVPTTLAGVKSDKWRVYFDLKGNLVDTVWNSQMRLRVLHRVTDPSAYIEHDGPWIVIPTLADATSQQAQGGSQDAQRIDFELPPGEEPVSRLVQVQLISGTGTVLSSAPPFLLTLKREGAGITPTVRGIALEGSPPPPPSPALPGTPAPADASLEAPTLAHTTKAFTTEGTILFGVPIREGRELLLKLDQAPHWKRLSLEKQEWLPLPPEDLAKAELTGSKDAIFVLLPKTGELKRYDVETLALQASRTLPPELKCLKVAAGSLTSSTPVAVKHEYGVVSCDAVTLAFTTAWSPRGLHSKPQEDWSFIANGDGSLIVEDRTKEDAYSRTGSLWAHPGGLKPYEKLNLNFDRSRYVRSR